MFGILMGIACSAVAGYGFIMFGTTGQLGWISFGSGSSEVAEGDDIRLYQQGQISWADLRSDMLPVYERAQLCAIHSNTTTQSLESFGCYVQSKKLYAKYGLMYSLKICMKGLSLGGTFASNGTIWLNFAEFIGACAVILYVIIRLPRGRLMLIDNLQDKVDQLIIYLQFNRIVSLIDGWFNPQQTTDLFNDERDIEKRLIENLEGSREMVEAVTRPFDVTQPHETLLSRGTMSHETLLSSAGLGAGRRRPESPVRGLEEPDCLRSFRRVGLDGANKKLNCISESDDGVERSGCSDGQCGGDDARTGGARTTWDQLEMRRPGGHSMQRHGATAGQQY